MRTSSNAGWFVAQLRPHGLKLARRNLAQQGFEVFAPEIPTGVKVRATGQRVRKLLFPGYIFVFFDPALNGWTAINSTRGIARLISGDIRRPRPLPASLVAGLKARCDTSDLVTSITDLKVGDKVRVLSGPFAELVTQIDSLTDQERVNVLIELMGRQVRTSLPRTQVSKMP